MRSPGGATQKAVTWRLIMRVMNVMMTIAAMGIAGCESDFLSSPLRSRPTRAVESPVEQNSASGEIRNSDATGVPLLKIEFPNTKDEQPKVYTIGDALTGKPTIQPATQPASTKAAATQTDVPAMTQQK